MELEPDEGPEKAVGCHAEGFVRHGAGNLEAYATAGFSMTGQAPPTK